MKEGRIIPISNTLSFVPGFLRKHKKTRKRPLDKLDRKTNTQIGIEFAQHICYKQDSEDL